MNYFKLIVVFLLGALLAVYTNCGKPSALLFENGYFSGPKASYEAYENSVYKITRSHCISCHADMQPTHASDDPKTAHDAAINKVNFLNIEASRLVAKLRDENHNCWGNCSDNANEMQKAIEKWASNRGTNETDEIADYAIYTAESDTLEMEFADAGNAPKSNTVRLNVDSAMLKSPMNKGTNEDGPYLWVPTSGPALLNATDPNAGTATMNFTVPQAGQYRVWGLLHGPADASNSFYVGIKNPAQASVSGGVRPWEFPVSGRFEWRMITSINANLLSNTTYSFELRERENGTKAQSFIITSDPSFNGQEVGDFLGITLNYDLSDLVKIPGATFQIDVVDYDLYSYKFSKPRINTPAGNLKVKNLKLLVNGQFNSQHSTYTLVDKVVGPGNGILSPYSMIVIKDKGLLQDRIKFSFDDLYQSNAVAQGGSSSGATSGATGGQTSIEAYQATVYPISRSSAYTCFSCHVGVSPRHASDNVGVAHDAALNIVDFTTPSNSRIVRKMRVDRHNCGANCDGIANLYEDAIKEWKTRRE